MPNREQVSFHDRLAQARQAVRANLVRAGVVRPAERVIDMETRSAVPVTTLAMESRPGTVRRTSDFDGVVPEWARAMQTLTRRGWVGEFGDTTIGSVTDWVPHENRLAELVMRYGVDGGGFVARAEAQNHCVLATTEDPITRIDRYRLDRVGPVGRHIHYLSGRVASIDGNYIISSYSTPLSLGSQEGQVMPANDFSDEDQRMLTQATMCQETERALFRIEAEMYYTTLIVKTHWPVTLGAPARREPRNPKLWQGGDSETAVVFLDLPGLTKRSRPVTEYPAPPIALRRYTRASISDQVWVLAPRDAVRLSVGGRVCAVSVPQGTAAEHARYLRDFIQTHYPFDTGA